MGYKINILRECIANCLMGIPLIRSWRVSRGRTASSIVDQQVQLILDQFDFFIESIGWENVRNKTVLEIGPGDSIPLGLLFLGAGAKRYVTVDRFLGDVSSESAKRLYQGLIKSAPRRVQDGWQEMGINPHLYPDINSGSFEQIKLVRKSIEETNLDESVRGDIILSFNVIEHLQNVPQACINMSGLLNPDGMMIHRVDYGPHAYRHKNPLMFLTLSNTLWSLMGSNRGAPNRLRHAHILQALKSSGFNSIDRVTHRYSQEDLKSVKPFISKEFSGLNYEDLLVADAEIFSSLSTVPLLRGHCFRTNESGSTLEFDKSSGCNIIANKLRA